MNESRPPTLTALPSYLAGHLARIGHRLLAGELAARELRLPHFAVMTALADFGSLAQHQLADRLGLNRSHVVGYLDLLESRSLVRRERDPDDRRRMRVTLTPEGHDLHAHLASVAHRSQRALLGALDESEQAVLVDLMRRVLEADDSGEVTARSGE
ncbi:MarR family transcriptional regulator [Streptomyces sp. NPDC005438]|uniref:MarR family winged helix-turn-helix transcriptional regulator n=1 Tax=Streptomyces sp. NPDC005438 TaxID=3156880 RepID=UPI0033B9C18B